MADSGVERCSRCRWLYSLAAECVIISLITIHALATTVEILVHLDLIHVPDQDTSSSLSNALTSTKATPSENTTADGIFDPGGDECDPRPKAEEMVVTIEVMRYTTLAISALFLFEMILKVINKSRDFFKDLWQVFDLLVVLLSFAIELAYYIEHDPLVCFHPATEVAGYIIVFRLWRIPRTCNIRKKQYASKLENELVFLRKTKSDADRKFKNLDEQYQKQVMSLEKLYTMCWEHSDIQIEVEKILKCDEPGSVSNGNCSTRRSFGNAIDAVLKRDEQKAVLEPPSDKTQANGFIPGIESKQTIHQSPIKESPIKQSPIPNGHAKKASKKEKHKKAKSKIESDSNHNSVEEGETLNIPKVNDIDSRLDSAIDEVFVDSDCSDTPIHTVATVQEVHVQIEEVTRQNQLPSISQSVVDDGDEVVMRRKQEQAAGVVNEGFTKDEDLDTQDGLTTDEEFDGSKTYRSADGIPMTDL